MNRSIHTQAVSKQYFEKKINNGLKINCDFKFEFIDIPKVG